MRGIRFMIRLVIVFKSRNSLNKKSRGKYIDQMLIQDTVDRIRKKKVNAEWALDLTLEKLDMAFKAIDDEYLRERRSDLHYVSARIFRNLLGKKHDDINRIQGKGVV